MVRKPLFEPKAAKRTVSITLNSDLYAKAKSVGINVSKVAEEAIGREYALRLSAIVEAELKEEIAACDAYAAEHGSFADMAREYFDGPDGAV